MITSIKEFKILENKKKETQKELSDDVTNIEMYDKDTLKPIDPEEYEIGEIVGVMTDVDEIEKIEEQTSGGMAMGMEPKSYKNGDIVWLTAMLQPRNKSAAYNIGEIGVIKCKIMQTFYGTNKLNQLKRRGLLHQ